MILSGLQFQTYKPFDFIGVSNFGTLELKTGHPKLNRTFVPVRSVQKPFVFRLFPAISG